MTTMKNKVYNENHANHANNTIPIVITGDGRD